MFLQLTHKSYDIYQLSRELVLETYRITSHFPNEEKYALTNQIRRAAVSVILNLSEGCSRKSIKERKRFYEVSRGSLVELDTAFELSVALKYSAEEDLKDHGKLIIRCFQMLSGMLDAPE